MTSLPHLFLSIHKFSLTCVRAQVLSNLKIPILNQHLPNVSQYTGTRALPLLSSLPTCHCTTTYKYVPHLLHCSSISLAAFPITDSRTMTTTAKSRAEGDLGNPQSTSSEQSSMKTSRATQGQKTQDTASVAQPVSNRSAIPGEKDESTPTEEEMKRDPKEPAESKRANVEKQGEKPLGPEDHQ